MSDGTALEFNIEPEIEKTFQRRARQDRHRRQHQRNTADQQNPNRGNNPNAQNGANVNARHNPIMLAHD